MTNATMNDVRELNEAELEFVSGGFGLWDAVTVAVGGLTTAAVKAWPEVLTDTGI